MTDKLQTGDTVVKERTIDDGFDYYAFDKCGVMLRSRERCGGHKVAWKPRRMTVNGERVKLSMYVCADHLWDNSRANDVYEQKAKKDYSGESSPYWDFVAAGGNGEEGRGLLEFSRRFQNLDSIDQADGLWTPGSLSSDLEEIVDEIKMAATVLLTPRQKQVFDLLVYERRSQDEIAERLGVTQPAISLQVSAIKKKLLAKLAKHTYGNDAATKEGAQP